MKNRILAIIALAVALPAAGLLAQDTNNPPPGPPPGENGGPPDGGPGGGGRHRHQPMPLIQALDSNHDGVISADEIANASAALLTLDKNGDGQLTPDEYLPAHPPRAGRGDNHNTNDVSQQSGPPDGKGPGHRPVPPIVAALDANHDGIISADEIANAPAALKTLDKNGDGQLTMDELMGPRPHHPGGPDGDGGPDGKGPGGPPPDGDGQNSPPPPGNN